jgi:hypothetical protein
MGALIKGFKDGGKKKIAPILLPHVTKRYGFQRGPPVEFQSIGMMLASPPITGTSVVNNLIYEYLRLFGQA